MGGRGRQEHALPAAEGAAGLAQVGHGGAVLLPRKRNGLAADLAGRADGELEADRVVDVVALAEGGVDPLEPDLREARRLHPPGDGVAVGHRERPRPAGVGVLAGPGQVAQQHLLRHRAPRVVLARAPDDLQDRPPGFSAPRMLRSAATAPVKNIFPKRENAMSKSPAKGWRSMSASTKRTFASPLPAASRRPSPRNASQQSMPTTSPSGATRPASRRAVSRKPQPASITRSPSRTSRRGNLARMQPGPAHEHVRPRREPGNEGPVPEPHEAGLLRLGRRAHGGLPGWPAPARGMARPPVIRIAAEGSRTGRQGAGRRLTPGPRRASG